jgi:alpha-beta hydrolase superfamily lysophospholipase
MIETTHTFNGTHHTPLHYHAWLPKSQPQALVALIHGIGEHCGRYPHLVDHLVPAGFAVTGYDQRGHGRSAGPRGHIHSWDEYRHDLQIFLDVARRDVPGLPVFLYAHSMGSLVGLDYLETRPPGLQGAVISATALQPVEAAPPLLKLVARVMSKIYPSFTMKVPLGGEGLSRDATVASGYGDDPLVHDQRTARWGAESMDVIERIKAGVKSIDLPLLIIHGGADTVVSPDGSRFVYENASSADKTLRIYPGGLHEPHNDIDHEQVMADVEAWLKAHLN